MHFSTIIGLCRRLLVLSLPEQASPRPRGLRLVATVGALFCLRCSSIWDPFLIYRCPSGEACSSDQATNNVSDMAVPGVLDMAEIRPAIFSGPIYFTVGMDPTAVVVGTSTAI